MTTDVHKAGRMSGPLSILPSAQDFTAAWVDLGSTTIEVEGVEKIAIWLVIDINNTTDARIRLVGLLEEGGTEYPFPIQTVSATVVAVAPEYKEFSNDVDQNVPLSWDLDAIVPFCKFQIQAGTVGATAGQITSAHITTS